MVGKERDEGQGEAEWPKHPLSAAVLFKIICFRHTCTEYQDHFKMNMFPQPFQTMVRGVSALRDDEKKEEKVSRPREPLMSLLDWAKSGGMEGFSLRGALRLPSFKVNASNRHFSYTRRFTPHSCVVFVYY